MSDLGTKVTDVLELYAQEITRSRDAGHCLDDSTTVGEAKYMALHDLAAALRAEQERVAELEAELRPFMTWTCANCGRVNPGTMPYCPCREESDE